MKNLILILLLSVTFACKKKDVKPTPQPDPAPPVVVCKSDLRMFEGTWVDIFGNSLEIKWVKNNCPDSENTNQYSLINFAACYNYYVKNPTYQIKDKERLQWVTEKYTGATAMKLDGDGGAEKPTSITIAVDNKERISIIFPAGSNYFYKKQ